jgi:hypothetical protein
VQTGKKELFFDASKSRHTPPKARPLEEQDERESQRLWHDVTEAVKRRDQETATTAKAKIEDRQREETAARNNENIDWHPQLFRHVKGGPGGPEEGEEDLDWIINARVSVSTPPLDLQGFTDTYSDGTSPEEQVKQILQIHSILPGQKPEKQFNIPQRNNSTQQTPAQQQPVQPEPTTLPQPQEQQRAPVQQEPQVQQVQQQLAGVDLNHSAPQPKADNGYEPISFSPYQAESAYQPPPAQSQTTETNPPSKLLHSNPAPEPTRDDKLRRKDSETQEDDEFHDAHS